MLRPSDRVTELSARAFRIPTDAPESDGTLEWDATTMVLVEIRAGREAGIGYSYTDASAAQLVRDKLAPLVVGADPLDVPRCWRTMVRAARNLGEEGLAAMAISAVDAALWDLKAKLLGLPLAKLLGLARDRVPVYGSGGFTSYDDDQLRKQLRGWAEQGLRWVKMKVGRDPQRDPERVAVARDAIGDGVGLFVDANGACTPKQALALAERFAEQGVTWFEEPVTVRDPNGLRLVRERAPAGMDIAAGEYGFGLADSERLLDAQAVDVLQADATRCMGISGFIAAAALCQARPVPLSAHCAPALHAQLGCALEPVWHLEWFHDHARIERMLFDGAPQPADGCVAPDLSRAGLGLELKASDAARYAL